MLRLSNCQKLLLQLQTAAYNRARLRICRSLELIDDESEDDIDAALLKSLQQLESTRYISSRGPYNQLDATEFVSNLLENQDDRTFQEEFRMAKPTFQHLLQLIGNDECFISKGHRPQHPAVLQVLVVLNRLGHNGNGASYGRLARIMQVSAGSIANFTDRVCGVIKRRLKGDYLKWPDAEERRLVKQRIQQRFHFPNCLGFVDGTLFPLEFKPRYCGEDFYSRKGCYAVSGIVVCDDTRRITYIYVGWPGSTHDQRILANSRMYQRKEEHFAPNEYVLGDSAFTVDLHCIPAFKKPPRGGLSRDEEFFNTRLGEARITIEHAIGIMKGRWQILKCVRIRVETVEDLLEVNTTVEVCAILHNFCLPESSDDFFQEESELQEENNNNEGVLFGQHVNVRRVRTPGEIRRQRLMNTLLEEFV